MRYRGYRTELEPTRAQVRLFRMHCGTARWAYNWALARKIQTYKATGRTPSAWDLEKELVQLKRTNLSWLALVSKCVPQTALRDVDTAFARFYAGLRGGRPSGFPRFKKRRRSPGAFRVAGSEIRVTDRLVWLPRIGWVRLKEHGYIPEAQHHMSAVVRERAGRWFISVLVRSDRVLPAPVDGVIIGLDLGVRRLATLSDGRVYPNARALETLSRHIAAAHRKQQRRVRGSGRWQRAALRLARLHLRAANVRADALHKMTSDLTRTKSTIVIETLCVVGMLQGQPLARVVSDAAFAEIQRQLRYKSAWCGGRVIEAPRFFPSTKRCSTCGYVGSIARGATTFVCPMCGYTDDRDMNAAKNLAQVAASPAFTEIARGEDVRPLAVADLVEAGTGTPPEDGVHG